MYSDCDVDPRWGLLNLRLLFRSGGYFRLFGGTRLSADPLFGSLLGFLHHLFLFGFTRFLLWLSFLRFALLFGGPLFGWLLLRFLGRALAHLAGGSLFRFLFGRHGGKQKFEFEF